MNTPKSTAYHPQANGMNERFNRTLKVALKAQQDPSCWYENLGLMLLSLRSVVKEDLGCSAMELTMGAHARLPGDFLDTTEIVDDTPSAYAHRLTQYMSQLKAVRPRHPSNLKTCVDRALQTCTHVFIRNNRVRPPLARPYSGPFLVLKRHDKYFEIDHRGRHDTISVDRLNPACMMPLGDLFLNSTPTEALEALTQQVPFTKQSKQVSPPVQLDEQTAAHAQSRAGRRLAPPLRFNDYVSYR